MQHRKIFGYLTIDMVLFAAANAYLLTRFSDRLAGLSRIGFLPFLILGLAAYRAANIVSNEAVTQPLRAPFVDEKLEDGKIVEKPKKSGFLKSVGLLIYCPSCTGVWLATVLVYCYAFWPIPTFVVALFLAMSAMERICAALVGFLKRMG